MARLTKSRSVHSSDDEFPNIDVLLKQTPRRVNKVAISTASKPAAPILVPEQLPALQGRKVRRLGVPKIQDLDNPLLKRWDTGEHDGLPTVNQIETKSNNNKARSRVSSQNQPGGTETLSATTQRSSSEIRTRAPRNRRPRIAPELADDSEDDSTEDLPSIQLRLKALQTQRDRDQKTAARPVSSIECSTQPTQTDSEQLYSSATILSKAQPRSRAESKREIETIQDEDSVYQTAAEPASDDSDTSHSDFTPDDPLNASRPKPSTRRQRRIHQGEAGNGDENKGRPRGRQASEFTLGRGYKETVDTDLTDTFSKLRLQLLEFSDEEVPPSRKERPSTPPPQDEPLKPKVLASPKKQPFIPRTPHKTNTDAFWSQDFVNDWNDKHSPRKPIFAPKPIGSPVKTSPSKQQKKSFAEKREATAEDFLKRLDAEITQGRIAELTASTGGVRLVWSKTLNTTAGRANWRREAVRSKQDSDPGSGSGAGRTTQYRHHAHIELAEKVLDSEDRLLNTLAHEFCHLASFMIDNITKNPHGRHFQAWGSKCTEAFGDSHGIKVTTKHSYAIDYKYVWQCGDCQLEFKRHSKSIDPMRHRCGKCHGELAQIKPVPRKGSAGVNGGSGSGKLSGYQIFMKDQMKVVREENPGSPQKEVMKIVADRWAKKNGKAKAKGLPSAANVDAVVRELEILTVGDEDE